MTSVTIPNSVTTISESAILSCNNLTKIKIPNNVITIGDGVFEGCNKDKLVMYVVKDSYAESYAKENSWKYNNDIITDIDIEIKINYGDVDGKQGIAVNDAACVLQKVLNMGIKLPIEEEETNDYMKYADVSGDGKLTALGAAMILHEDFVFPVEK